MGTSRGRELPPRPYLPPSMAGAAGALAGAGAVLEEGWRCLGGRGPAGTRAVAAACLALGAAAVLWSLAARRRGAPRSLGPARRWALWFGLGASVGALSGLGGAAARLAASEALLSAPASSFAFEVRGDPAVSDRGCSCDAVALDASGRAVGTVRLSTDEPYEDGTLLDVVGRIEELPRDEWGRGRYMDGCAADVEAAAVLGEAARPRGPIGWLRHGVLRAIEPARDAGGALLAGIVCGRSTELAAAPASDAFARTGTSHLVAVSGSHLALLAALARWALARLGAAPRARTVALAILMSAYVVFTGGAPSAVRSLLMVGLSLVAGLGRRRAHGLSALALTAVALVARDGGVVFDLGFQLSAASVLFIQLFFGYLSCLLGRLGLPRALAEPLALTLCAQWGTVPLTVPVFGELSVIAPAANLVLGPLMSALLVAGLAAAPATLLLPPLAGALLLVPRVLAALSVFIADVLASVPFAAVRLPATPALACGAYLLAAGVYLVWADARRWHVLAAVSAPAALLALHVCRWALFAPAEVVVLDVGQADAILVRDGPAAILVDAGVDDAVADALARNGVFRLDAVVITHWDADHCGGLGSVLDGLPVDRVVVARGAVRGMPDAVRGLDLPDVVQMDAGDVLRAGGFACTMLWPREKTEGRENGDSLVLSVRYESGGRSLSALLTGDTEAPEAERYAAAAGDVDVLKLGHHGSARSVSAEALEALDPELAVASAGEDNPYGHPAPACRELVSAAGARFLCTRDVGDVTLEPAAAGPRIRTQHRVP